MSELRARLTVAQVREAERMAWASSRGDDTPDYFYDGIIFWRLLPDGEMAGAHPDELPASGWWHREDCPCPLCVRE